MVSVLTQLGVSPISAKTDFEKSKGDTLIEKMHGGIMIYILIKSCSSLLPENLKIFQFGAEESFKKAKNACVFHSFSRELQRLAQKVVEDRYTGYVGESGSKQELQLVCGRWVLRILCLNLELIL